MKELTKLGIKYMTDKAYFHSFTEFYNDPFSNYQDKEINILEIGIATGASLRMLSDFFPKANIYAIDINPNVTDLFYGDRIKTYLCSQIDFSKLNSLFGNIKFDIIIDDGSHMTSHQQKSLGHLFPYVTDGGIYVCEDLHTSYRRDFVDTAQHTVELFQNYNMRGVFECNLLNNTQLTYLNNSIKQLVLFTRNTNAHQCWNCKAVNTLNVGKCVCGTTLDPLNDLSMSSIIYKK
jgi:23S rRNA U2552 (ribose-2'-O)-methylase RlmE/FtsJ